MPLELTIFPNELNTLEFSNKRSAVTKHNL